MIRRLVALLVLLGLGACTSVPSCASNPRNMSCMTADQLERELNQ